MESATAKHGQCCKNKLWQSIWQTTSTPSFEKGSFWWPSGATGNFILCFLTGLTETHRKRHKLKLNPADMPLIHIISISCKGAL